MTVVPCQICGKPEAPVHLTDIVDGQKKTLVLCETCASEKGFVIDAGLIQAAAAQIKKILAPAIVNDREVRETTSARCPRCGLSWKEFRKSSRFGCAHDYEFFGGEVERLLKKVHGQSRHRGREPGTASGARTGPMRLIARLRADLDAAILQEDYERAADLRDRIRVLEQEGERDRGAV